jgi:hypothetical protein
VGVIDDLVGVCDNARRFADRVSGCVTGWMIMVFAVMLRFGVLCRSGHC